MKLLIIIDMQNDFIDGALGTKEAARIVPLVAEKIAEYRSAGNPVVFTRDTHQKNYLTTQEGKIFLSNTALKIRTAGRFQTNSTRLTVRFLTSRHSVRLNLQNTPHQFLPLQKSKSQDFVPTSA